MRAYLLQHAVANTPNTAFAAINNPAASGVRVEICGIENALLTTGAASDFRIDRYAALATGGSAAAFEPGDDDADLPRVCRRDSSDPEPAFVVLGGAFAAPSGRTFDESVSLRSREPNNEQRDMRAFPIVLNPGECAVITLLETEASSGARISVNVCEHDEVPPIHVGEHDVTRLEGELFDGSGGLSSRWVVTPAGDGYATMSGVELLVGTGAAANSALVTESARHARFMSDETHEWEAWICIPDAGVVDNVRRWGALLAADGFYFELSGTAFGVGTRKASSNSSVVAAAWNRRGFVLDTNYHHYLIRYNGNAVEFWIDHVFVHRVFGVSAPLTSTLDLPIRFENLNSNGLTGDVTMFVRGASIKRYAPQSGALRTVHFGAGAASTLLKSGAGTLGSVSLTGAGVGGGTVTIYDSLTASGTILGHYETGTVGQYIRNVDFSTGLFIDKNANSPPVDVDFD